MIFNELISFFVFFWNGNIKYGCEGEMRKCILVVYVLSSEYLVNSGYRYNC